ncbi:galactoside alpha-(1,2)-fucosyltransferase 2-like [Mercenaria mercenaria]|uniref:galactoside alpha-(1,2)-fucosyltransferase 2-like n=1 Tax=Mercenaria mercenaria TaxID=6596 RepID=UPI00234F84AA|nr:galactoside alpha-(1,2)-fucosyltransferase 2-like [Mercenaria mercenaria]
MDTCVYEFTTMAQMLKNVLKIICNYKVIVCALICLFFVSGFIYGLLYTNLWTNLLQSSFTSDKMTPKYCFKLFTLKYRTLEHITKMDAIDSSKDRDIGLKMTDKNDTGNTSNKFGIKSKACRRFVTLGGYKGRMGNQMFEFASLVGTAYKYDVIPVIPTLFPLKRYFDLPNIVDLKLNKLVNVVNCVCGKSAVYYNCTQEFNTGKNISLHGYLQSWKYFKEASDIIKTVFKVKSNHLLNAQRFLTNVSIAGYQLVCIHIRRGDILAKAKIDDGYAVADLDFMDKAIFFYRNKYSRVQFLVVSDDKVWCRKHLRDVVISPLTDPGDEMALMTLSNHVVVTTGTFGWWGAWLSGGTTVYFDKYPRPGSPLASRISREDYYPPSWIGMS